MSEFGAFIATQLARERISAAAMANRMDVEPSQLSRVVNGERRFIRPDTLARIVSGISSDEATQAAALAAYLRDISSSIPASKLLRISCKD